MFFPGPRIYRGPDGSAGRAVVKGCLVGGWVLVSELRPEDPQAIGPYRLVGQLGQGGMGRVYLGVSPGGRPVAVKAIRAELAADPEFRRRFGQEVASARRVSGVYTAQVVDADVDGPVAWMATAYVPGPSLAEAVDTHGPLPEASLLALAAGLAESLSAIHAAGVVHRDLKPSNVLLAEDGPRVIDFGISRAVESTMLTQAGLVVGSPGFMSPEQATGYQVGPPSDIFNLGAVLAFAATGEGPFGTGTTAALLYRVVHGTPSLDRVPPAVRPLIERCLAKDPSQRPTASGLLAEVGALQPGGNWLPDSLTRTFAAGTPSRPGFAGLAGYAPPGPGYAPAGPATGLGATRSTAAGPGPQPSTRDSWPQVAAAGVPPTPVPGGMAPTPARWPIRPSPDDPAAGRPEPPAAPPGAAAGAGAGPRRHRRGRRRGRLRGVLDGPLDHPPARPAGRSDVLGALLGRSLGLRRVGLPVGLAEHVRPGEHGAVHPPAPVSQRARLADRAADHVDVAYDEPNVVADYVSDDDAYHDADDGTTDVRAAVVGPGLIGFIRAGLRESQEIPPLEPIPGVIRLAMPNVGLTPPALIGHPPPGRRWAGWAEPEWPPGPGSPGRLSRPRLCPGPRRAGVSGATGTPACRQETPTVRLAWPRAGSRRRQ